MRPLATILGVLAIVAISAAVATATSKPAANASATDRSVVKELRKLNRNLQALRRAVDGPLGLSYDLERHDQTLRNGIANIQRDLNRYP